ncbi:4-hydroxy-tetrahydrodipicolinate reductase [Capnocytophaga granulosa]|uniref:4-hydroxy-tetrahydrodipicolinate reductase n=1 Tax=Capnocytophaga granulosa TaxID=45242 RepID=UPI0028E3489B|nr:4-hydroxy-tetrahydrodipicolinate reductase [Capnocytophaga granulosa]
MKIALLGYGKMGKTIERIAQERGHEIVLKVDAPGDYDLSVAEVAIEFSTPQSAFANISRVLSLGLPTVAGTTGWLEHYPEAVTLCKEHEAAFLYASNFSIGVNIFFELNKTLAQLMRKYPEYAVAIEEIHHTQKLDAPSGTAITLAQEIIEQTDKVGWELGETTEDKIPITAKRIENVPGTHIVTYKSVVDTLEIKHTAHSRDGFALGAVLAAEWIIGKKGVFSMKDVLFGK